MTTPEQPEKIQIQLNSNDASPARSLYRRKKTPWWQSPAAIIGGILIVAILGWVALRPDPPKKTRTLRISDSPPLSVNESALWTYQTPVKGKGVSRDSLRFELTEGPEGVSIDAETGGERGLGGQPVAGAVVARRDVVLQAVMDAAPERVGFVSGHVTEVSRAAGLLAARVCGKDLSSCIVNSTNPQGVQ